MYVGTRIRKQPDSQRLVWRWIEAYGRSSKIPQKALPNIFKDHDDM
jgi:hypothetical protein